MTAAGWLPFFVARTNVRLKSATSTIELQHPVVMGVLNVTPDSFSDDGLHLDTDLAVRRAETMSQEGAAIIDIGGESTRPGATEVSEQHELERVLPVIEALHARIDVPLAIDTSKAPVMVAAAAAGVAMVNDVYALRREGALRAARQTGCAVCLMHMLGTPRSMQSNPQYTNVAAEVREFLEERVSACIAEGISADRIVVDPGFGFGKTDRHNLELLANLGELTALDRPILVGISRKRTLGSVTGRDISGRMPAGIAAAVLACERGASIIRTHDVAPTVDALKIAAAVRELAADKR